ncbi:MAG TPA: ABC transporter substrate-binding protein [Acidimicrobiia bacterium]|nr:ABC transporter substrate-binding protein [Acidimicrobiia bacterium]
MRRFRWVIAPVIATCVVAMATSGMAPAQTGGGTKTASEVGIDASNINITVPAAIDVPGSAGLFQGSGLGVKAWADYENAKGGLAGRHINVTVVDTKLGSEPATNAFIQGCSNSFAMIGTSVLLAQNFSDLLNCKDKAGATTGLPDFPVVVTEVAQQCSPTSFPINPPTLDCATKDQHPQTYRAGTGPASYYTKKFGKLKGAFVYPSPAESASAKAAQVPIFTALQQKGISQVFTQDVSAFATRGEYTPIVGSIASNNATYAQSGLDVAGTVKLRQEAQTQQTNVKVWNCSLQCYDTKLIAQGGSAVEGEYVYTPFLPFLGKNNEAKQNPMLAAFLKYDKSPDGFGIQAFAAGLYFTDLVNKVVAKSGVNGLTRKAVLAEAPLVHNFNAGGMIGTTDVGNRTPSPCFVLNQVKNGDYVRVLPTAKGTFNCTPSNVVSEKLDLIK